MKTAIILMLFIFADLATGLESKTDDEIHENDVKQNTSKDSNSSLSPLHYAASYGEDEIVDQLIARSGADVNVEDLDGSTPLDYAVWDGHEQVVNVLFNHGVQVDHADKHGMTALQIAANRGHLNIVNLLIKNGADVNHVDKNGYSVLDWTPHKEYPDIAKLLMKYGAKLNRLSWSRL